MTPLMIGLIVAASVVAVFFVIMAAVVPSMSQNINMQIREELIIGNSTSDHFSLDFDIMCDYEAGEVWRAEIYKNSSTQNAFTLYGYTSLTDEVSFKRNEERTIKVLYFTAEAGVDPTEVDGVRLIFQVGDEYVLRVYYRPLDKPEETSLFTEATFEFKTK